MAYDFLMLGTTDRVGWIEYRRPPVNAIHWEMLAEIARAFAELRDAPETRVIVFASALERFFTAGAEIGVMAAMSQADLARWVNACHDLVRQVRASAKPVLAAIHGTAVGGGLELVLNCDVRFAADTARLGQPEINIAFIPPVGATQSYARLLGRPRAIRFLYDGALLTAAEALALGFVDEIVPTDRLRDHVQEYAAGLARKPAEALAAIRRCITEGIDRPFEGPAIERAAAVHLTGTPDFAEGLRAFLDKRPPKWES
ncbi:MAG TPA: enoyl-CoA hydratase-related protein [Dehalococcoidia bacterium]|nr:enoyl-CoA hydratase-related protein [Dehalococcoidia bacterium]